MQKMETRSLEVRNPVSLDDFNVPLSSRTALDFARGDFSELTSVLRDHNLRQNYGFLRRVDISSENDPLMSPWTKFCSKVYAGYGFKGLIHHPPYTSQDYGVMKLAAYAFDKAGRFLEESMKQVICLEEPKTRFVDGVLICRGQAQEYFSNLLWNKYDPNLELIREALRRTSLAIDDSQRALDFMD